jgi:hypothetical protein
MKNITRRELLQQASIITTASVLGSSFPGSAQPVAGPANELNKPIYEWIRSARLMIAEAYNPPFYPSFTYEPEKALAIAKALNADSIRYPTASYFAYYPTKTKYPIHPELGTRDPFRRTIELFHNAGLKVVAYNPLNHPFMDVNSDNPDYQNWTKRFIDGRPMTTAHLGWTRYYEGCLNSPYRDVIKARVLEVLTNYPAEVMYFDGPYQGMENSQHFCHCQYCKAAYEKARGKSIPLQDSTTTLEDEIEYRQWMEQDVMVGILREMHEMIRKTRDVPVLFNNTGLLG